MWDAFWNWMPDVKPGTLEIRDIIGLFVAGLALALSIIAIRMARRQETMMRAQGGIVDRQLEMMTLEVEAGKRLEALAAEQATIARLQGEIVENQYLIQEATHDRKLSFVVTMDGSGDGSTQCVYFISMKNIGIAPTHVWWLELELEVDDYGSAEIEDAHPGTVNIDRHQKPSHVYFKFTPDVLVVPGVRNIIGSFRLASAEPAKVIQGKWSISTRFGEASGHVVCYGPGIVRKMPP